MILVIFLLGGAFWWGLYQWLGQPVVVLLALAVFALVVIGAFGDVWRGIQASRVAARRWRSWTLGDRMAAEARDEAALRRILRGHRG